MLLTLSYSESAYPITPVEPLELYTRISNYFYSPLTIIESGQTNKQTKADT